MSADVRLKGRYGWGRRTGRSELGHQAVVVAVVVAFLIAIFTLTPARAFASMVNGVTTSSIPIVGYAGAVAVDPSTHRVYVISGIDTVSAVEDSVLVIDESGDAHSGTVTATIILPVIYEGALCVKSTGRVFRPVPLRPVGRWGVLGRVEVGLSVVAEKREGGQGPAGGRPVGEALRARSVAGGSLVAKPVTASQYAPFPG